MEISFNNSEFQSFAKKGDPKSMNPKYRFRESNKTHTMLLTEEGPSNDAGSKSPNINRPIPII